MSATLAGAEVLAGAQVLARTKVFADAEAASVEAAERFVAACAAGPERIAVCFSGGSTPKRFYGLLATEPYRDRVPWARVHAFLGDERVVPADSPDSNLGMLRATLLDHVPIPPGNVHPVPTDAAPEDCAARYEAELRRWYGADALDPARPLFDLMLLGTGPDGHTASLFPGKPEIETRGRFAVAVPEPGLPPKVARVSLTFEALSSCRTMLFLATGASKREPIARIAAGEALPAGRVSGQDETVWLLDRAAAGGEP